MAQAGADAIKIKPAQGEPLRRWRAPLRILSTVTLPSARTRGEHPAGAGDNAVLFVDQHGVGEAKFADRGGDLRDLLVAVRARVSGVGDQRRAPAPNNRLR